MIRIFTCILLLFMFNDINAQTQAEMNATAYKDYQKAEKKLNVVYQQVLKEYQSDTTFIKNLKAAQGAWLKYRDAEMQAKYPNDRIYGSIQPVCTASFKKQLTEERIAHLQTWLRGMEEGDVCAGSVKFNLTSKQ